ncbi:MAG TPA: HAD family hydrolase [Polyangiaceae bacterium]
MASDARALFLDRDGTLIVDVGYPRDPAQVTLIAGVADALRGAKALGYELIIISNQSGVGRGLILPKEAARVQQRVAEMLVARGVVLDAAYFCPHAPDDACACRKPSPEMLLSAARERTLDLSRSVMVGDKASDVEAGRAAGCKTVLYGTDARITADLVTTSWSAILSQLAVW